MPYPIPDRLKGAVERSTLPHRILQKAVVDYYKNKFDLNSVSVPGSGLNLSSVNQAQSTVDPNANLRDQLQSSDPAVRKRAQEEQLRRQNSENLMRDRSSPDSAMRAESYSNRRLGIILETVSEILEDAERARSRREHRKSEAKEAGERVASAFAVFGPGGIGNYDLERLGMVVKGSAQRKAAAAELVKARQQHQGTDEAQRILDVDSYKFGISPSERKDRYKARKKTRKK